VEGAAESKTATVKPRTKWRSFAAAAAIVLALGGGYLAGHRTASDPQASVPAIAVNTTPSSAVAPAPTRVIEVDTWQHLEGGR